MSLCSKGQFLHLISLLSFCHKEWCSTLHFKWCDEEWIIGKDTQKDLKRSLTPTLRKDQLHFWHDSQIFAKISVLKMSSSGAPRACLVMKPMLHCISEFLIGDLFLYPVWIPFLQSSHLFLPCLLYCTEKIVLPLSVKHLFFNMLE